MFYDIGVNVKCKQFAKDLNKVLDRATKKNVKMIFTGTDMETSMFSSKRAMHTKQYSTIGFHPHSAKKFKEGYTLPNIVIHCYTGSDKQVQQYIKMGFYISFAGTICMDKRGRTLREKVLQHVPVDKLMLETDAPYMHPSGKRERCEPVDVITVYKTVSELLGVDIDLLAETIEKNVQMFFCL